MGVLSGEACCHPAQFAGGSPEIARSSSSWKGGRGKGWFVFWSLAWSSQNKTWVPRFSLNMRMGSCSLPLLRGSPVLLLLHFLLQAAAEEPTPPEASFLGQAETTDSQLPGEESMYPMDGLSKGQATRDSIGFGGIKHSEGLFGSMAASSGKSPCCLLP